MYSPILRNRQSEILAIKHLSKSIRSHVIPIIDVAAPTASADVTKAVGYVEKNIGRTQKYVTGFPAVFIDSSELEPGFRLSGNLHPLESAAIAIALAGSRPIPVTGIHRDDAHNAAVAAVVESQDGSSICVRLDATDVSTATLTFKRLGDLLETLSFGSTNTYLLLDLQCLFGQEQDAVAKQVLRLLKLLEAQTWAGIIVGGYGFPDQISTAVASREQGYVRRVEQEIFRIAAARPMVTRRWFADYTTLSPTVVELDYRLIHKLMCPKAIYTLDDFWFVVRGGAVSSHPDGYGQYFSIAGEIVALEEYSGPNYSYGDAYIADRANKIGRPGSPASWITACVNHHITFTANAHATDTES
jgi:Beta protein